MKLLKLGLPVFLLCSLALGEASYANEGKPYSLLLAENSSRKAYDPFIDYTEFRDNVTEQQTINFFQFGRSLSLGLFGGYESVTLTMRELYGDSFSFFGASIGYFFDLNMSFQVSVGFPRSHFNSITQSNHSFSSYSLDFKYYFNKQNIVKGLSFLNPYLTFGPFWLGTNVTVNSALDASSASTPATPPSISAGPTQNILQLPNINNSRGPITNEERNSIETHKAYGFKLGLGVEIPIMKQTYIGIEAAFYYVNLLFENEDLSDIILAKVNPVSYHTIIDRLLIPPQPGQLKGLRFYGDMVNTTFLLGTNF